MVYYYIKESKKIMKIKEGFVVRKIAGDTVVVPIGKNIDSMNGTIVLNDTAAFMWEQLQTETSAEEITERLLTEYDVLPEKAAADTEKFLSVLREHSILEV